MFFYRPGTAMNLVEQKKQVPALRTIKDGHCNSTCMPNSNTCVVPSSLDFFKLLDLSLNIIFPSYLVGRWIEGNLKSLVLLDVISDKCFDPYSWYQ